MSFSRSDLVSQRTQFEKGGIGQWFRLFRDKKVFSLIKEDCHCLIDLGCGEGITLEALLKRFPGKECLGIDRDEENVKKCRFYRLPVVCGDICHLSIKTGSTDCCLLMDVIEHLDSPETALKEILRILRPGGRLILIFPNDWMFFLARLLFLKFREAFHDAGHVRQWNPKKMGSLLEAKGFKVSRRTSLPFFFWPVSLYHLIEAEKR